MLPQKKWLFSPPPDKRRHKTRELFMKMSRSSLLAGSGVELALVRPVPYKNKFSPLHPENSLQENMCWILFNVWILKNTKIKLPESELQFPPPPVDGVATVRAAERCVDVSSRRWVSSSLDEEIASLLNKRAIWVGPPEDSHHSFYSRYIVIPKRGGALCPILDLKQPQHTPQKIQVQNAHIQCDISLGKRLIHVTRWSERCIFSRRRLPGTQKIP